MNYYSENASLLFDLYNRVDPPVLHQDWAQHLPDQPGLACDIGAGTGRDANWLAKMGWDVIAVEPEKALREQAKGQSHENVAWLDDHLPDLSQLRRLGQRFNLILLSAVWMHIPNAKRERAFRILSELLAPGGILVISLRQGKDKAENQARSFHTVSIKELEHLARGRALSTLSVFRHSDSQNRGHVSWETVVMTMPDDGTGSLPLLRHIIVNDDKSGTYKLGLLRTLIRIADGAPGMVLKQTDDYVEVPLGLVGLYWLKLYMPLVLTQNLILSPSHKPEEKKGLGFAKAEHFYQLTKLSPYDLRVGASFSPELASVVIGSIKDACDTIKNMPAHFITYPGQSRQVFECQKQSFRTNKNQHWQINKESLKDFGTFRIPIALWQSFSQYACWLEPAILTEWARLMDSYNGQYDKSVYDRVFQWEDSKRSTAQVRNLAEQASPLNCIWTGQKLAKQSYQIDHCFPWSRWFNNDLWNLMPTSIKVNNNKGGKLPSAATMHASRERIQAWWEMAYAEEQIRKQFQMEAEASLPLLNEGKASVDQIFDAVLYQRTRLRIDQQLVEWQPR
jgi:SAM-dependent methyltransferase